MEYLPVRAYPKTSLWQYVNHTNYHTPLKVSFQWALVVNLPCSRITYGDHILENPGISWDFIFGLENKGNVLEYLVFFIG